MGSPPAHVPRRLKRGRHDNDRRAHSLDMALLEEMYWRQLRITQVHMYNKIIYSREHCQTLVGNVWTGPL